MKKNIFGGLLFLLGAVLLIAGSLGLFHGLELFHGIGFWRILFTLASLALLLHGIFYFDIRKILFSIAFLIIIYAKLLGLEALTPWPVLGAALLGSIGLNMIFPNIKKKFRNSHAEFPEDTGTYIESSPVLPQIPEADETPETAENIEFSAIFSSSVHYLHGSSLQSMTIDCVFGNFTAYFDQADLKNNSARLTIDTIFGQTRLFLPREWNVIVRTDNVLGSTQEKGWCNPNGENTLEIDGDIVFGKLEINYI